MAKYLQILTLKGHHITPYLSDLARLGVKIFREYPYLLEADQVDEANYGKRYAQCDSSIMVIVLDQKKVVGASTGMPLDADTEPFKNPFRDNGIPPENVFYLGESLLLPAYRGKGLYRHFFEEREKMARECNCKIVAFSAVDREPDNSKEPANYTPLDPTWLHFGYKKHTNIYTYFDWKDINETQTSSKRLVFWLKKL